MRAHLTLTAIGLAAMLAHAGTASAQGWADRPFDPAPMSREDIATVQAALAFSADYYGFTDGVWNDDAQAALEAWVKREEGADQPLYRHLEDLIMALEDERVRNGWQLFYSETTDTSYLHPFELLKEVDNPDAVEFLSADENFSVYVRFNDLEGMKGIHDWFMSKSLPTADPYQFSDDTLWITSTTIENDYIAYARSDLYKGDWSTISIVISEDYFPQLNLMAASMTKGGSPATLIWTKGGVIDQIINGTTAGAAPAARIAGTGPKDQVLRPMPPGVDAPPPAAAEVAEGPAPAAGPEAAPGGGAATTSPGLPEARPPGNSAALPETPPPEAPEPPVAGTPVGSGTGFYIAPTMLATAAHVIEGCGTVATADGTRLEVLAQDKALDLAVLAGAPDAGAWLNLSALEVPMLGEAVTALGYPYYTSLDQGLTVTNGNISALRGLDGSTDRVMISAPVQPGNSGGPLLNRKGAVIGVVVSRIDDLVVLEETGTLPQNMNFAVPSGRLLTLMAQNRIARPQEQGIDADLSGGVPERVARAVVPLNCFE